MQDTGRFSKKNSGRETGALVPPPPPLLLPIGTWEGLVQETMSLSDETARQPEAVGEGPVRGTVRRLVVAAALVEPQGRLVDLVYVQEHLEQFWFLRFSFAMLYEQQRGGGGGDTRSSLGSRSPSSRELKVGKNNKNRHGSWAIL